ncbi:prepilin-type N-terminal cleavage/methylation domain-containing protein [Piscinibacter sp.]|uniref:prepilin-type N-terminal cleavage/methylation domain-containing protein n=1 Tax=Piscinibacter sp. TaxID=1903157 RepID=UPI0039E55662
MGRRSQAGVSLVELMVGLALGLFIAAAAFTAVVAQWREHRHATLALRLQQDLRSAADVISRDLRRAGHWAAPAASAANPYAAFAPQGAASDAASYAYSRDTAENHTLDSAEQFGLRLRRGVIELQLGAGAWQALTDAGALVVTEFSLAPREQSVSLLEHCPRECADGALCEALVSVRRVALRIAAHTAEDTSLRRRVDTLVRLRNDDVAGACPA